MITYEAMAKKKQKLFMLSDEDLELLAALRGELFEHGLRVTDSDLVAMGLRQIKKQGGVLETIQKEKDAKAS